jgi:hypothetical protein
VAEHRLDDHACAVVEMADPATPVMAPENVVVAEPFEKVRVPPFRFRAPEFVRLATVVPEEGRIVCPPDRSYAPVIEFVVPNVSVPAPDFTRPPDVERVTFGSIVKFVVVVMLAVVVPVAPNWTTEAAAEVSVDGFVVEVRFPAESMSVFAGALLFPACGALTPGVRVTV